MADCAIACVILAGGLSSRMGVEKAFLELMGRPLIRWTLDALDGLGQESIIVTNTPELYACMGLRVVTDLVPGRGVLGGLYTALSSTRCDRALVVACDMPFLNPSLLRFEIELAAAGGDAVVPRLGDYLEPLHAVYSRACLDAIQAVMSAGRSRLFDFLQRVHVRYVDAAEIDRFDPEHRSFLNVNTPADWDVVQRIAEQGAHL